MDTIVRATGRHRTAPTHDLRCPVCRSVDWHRDGLEIVAVPATADVLRRRIGGSTRGPADAAWTCGTCGHALGPSREIAHELRMLRLTNVE